MNRLRLSHRVPVPQTAGGSSTGPLEGLQDLLEADEDTFLAVLSALDEGDAGDHVVTHDARTQFMRQALVLDRPRALFAIRGTAQSRPTLSSGRSASSDSFTDAALVRHARREKPLALTLELYRRGHVTPADVRRALDGVDVPTLVGLCERDDDTDMVRSYVIGRRARFDVDDLRLLCGQGVLDEAAYCALAAPERTPAQVNALLMDAALGVISTQALFVYTNPNVDDAMQWVKDGLLSGDALLAHCDAISCEDVRTLHALGHLSMRTYFDSGRALLSDVLRWLAEGKVTAEAVARHYTLPGATLEQLYAGGEIDADTYAARWQRGLTLPRGYTDNTPAAQLNDTIRAIPSPQDQAARRSMRLWLYAERLEALSAASLSDQARDATVRDHAATSTLTKLFRRLGYGSPVASAPVSAASGSNDSRPSSVRRLRSVASSHTASVKSLVRSTTRTQAPEACLACTEPFNDQAPAFKLAGCEHAPHFHVECARRAFDARYEQGLPPCCTSVGCHRGLSMADGRAMGINADAMDALATSKIRAFKPEHWHPCGTRECLGGAVVPQGQTHLLHCMHCEAETRIENRTPLQVRLVHILVPLIEGMGNAHRATRSCYHCGIATQHMDGCSAMVCGRDTDGGARVIHGGCGQTWDFIMGSYTTRRNGEVGGAQQYVPMRGDMVDAGLYAPLRPGTVLNSRKDLPNGMQSIQDLVIKNAVDKGWVRRSGNTVVLVG